VSLLVILGQEEEEEEKNKHKTPRIVIKIQKRIRLLLSQKNTRILIPDK
jgi:hypothetical protein